MSIDTTQGQAGPENTETLPTLEWVDVAEIAAHPGNPREQIKFKPGFLDSLKQFGVRIPVLLTTDEESPEAGCRLLVDGHIRVAGCLEVGVMKVPAFCEPDRSKAQQFFDMWLTSELKTELTDLEAAHALFSAHQAADKAGKALMSKVVGKGQVQTALKVAGMPEQAQAAVRGADYEMSLDQLAQLADFADNPEVTTRLINAARAGNLAYEVRRENERRAEAAARVKLAAKLRREDVTVLDKEPDGSVRLYQLSDEDGEDITPEAHASCPGHAAVMVTWKTDEPLWVCTAPENHPQDGEDEDGDSKVPEQAPHARDVVIRGNKDDDAAREVRREFLTNLFKRSKLAKADAEAIARFVARSYLICPDPAMRGEKPKARQLATELLGLTVDTSDTPEWKRPNLYREAMAEFADTVSNGRLALMPLVQLAAGYEDVYSRLAWRTDQGNYEGWHTTLRGYAREWLNFLVILGYVLSPIEQAIVDDATYQPFNLSPTASAAPAGTLTDQDQEEETEQTD